jgi:hypothetical protein
MVGDLFAFAAMEQNMNDEKKNVNVVPFQPQLDEAAEKLADMTDEGRAFALSAYANELDLSEQVLRSAYSKVLRVRAERNVAIRLQQERVLNEVKRLAELDEPDRLFQIDHGSAEQLDIEAKELKQLVKAEVRERDKEKADDCARQEAINKAAKEKQKAKEKGLADIAKLPQAKQDTKVEQLAEKLDLDLPALRDEFVELTKADKEASEFSLWDVMPWSQPVTTAELLSALVNKYSKHIAAEMHEIMVLALWAMMTWVYQEAARHSAFLVLTSADPLAGKTTTLEVLYFTTLRPSLEVEISLAQLYRFIDQHKPTELFDETEGMTKRKDLMSIVLASHSREFTVGRTGKGGRGERFSPWCPKAFGLVDLNVPPAMVSRSIIIQLWEKLPDSPVKFDRCDDEEFATLRQMSARWANDNAATLKGKEPLFPAGFDNRLADLWRLPLAIAELAEGDWPQQARTAAERLARAHPTPSWRRLLLNVVAKMAANGRNTCCRKRCIKKCFAIRPARSMNTRASAVGLERSRSGKSLICSRA